MTHMTGGCLCGNIRYAIKTEPALTVVCHCTHCQKASGSAFSTNLVAPRADVEFTGGDMAVYEDSADSGNTLKRSFCPKCGSSIMSEFERPPRRLRHEGRHARRHIEDRADHADLDALSAALGAIQGRDGVDGKGAVATSGPARMRPRPSYALIGTLAVQH